MSDSEGPDSPSRQFDPQQWLRNESDLDEGREKVAGSEDEVVNELDPEFWEMPPAGDQAERIEANAGREEADTLDLPVFVETVAEPPQETPELSGKTESPDRGERGSQKSELRSAAVTASAGPQPVMPSARSRLPLLVKGGLVVLAGVVVVQHFLLSQEQARVKRQAQAIVLLGGQAQNNELARVIDSLQAELRKAGAQVKASEDRTRLAETTLRDANAKLELSNRELERQKAEAPLVVAEKKADELRPEKGVERPEDSDPSRAHLRKPIGSLEGVEKARESVETGEDSHAKLLARLQSAETAEQEWRTWAGRFASALKYEPPIPQDGEALARWTETLTREASMLREKQDRQAGAVAQTEKTLGSVRTELEAARVKTLRAEAALGRWADWARRLASTVGLPETLPHPTAATDDPAAAWRGRLLDAVTTRAAENAELQGPFDRSEHRRKQSLGSYHKALDDVQSGNYPVAVQRLNEAIRLFPGDARYYYFRGIARAMVSPSAGAIESREVLDDMRRGAELESKQQPGSREVSQALERIQFQTRRWIETFRIPNE